MRSGIFWGLVVGGVLAGSALAAERGQPVGPGGKIGVMTVVRGDSYQADERVWVGGCDRSISKAGTYHWSCSVPKLPRLFIGTYWAGLTQKELANTWKHEHWKLSVDGTPVDLPRFGTTDFHAPNGKLKFFRNWKVILVNAPSGEHTIHYDWQLPSGPAALTLAVTVRK